MKQNILSMLARGFLIALIISSHSVTAEEKEYVSDYEYQATDYDSKFTSRINAIDGLKTSLLEELGAYVQSVINVNKDSLGNAYMTNDTVQITAGIISLKLLQEEWNRITYYVKGKMRADHDDVLKAVKALREDKQLENALRDSMSELDAARKEIEKLKNQMAQMQSAQQEQYAAKYLDAVKNIEVEYMFQQAMLARIDGDFEKAVKLFRELAEKGYAKAQSRLGHMYEKGMGVEQDYGKAIEWYKKAVAKGYAGSLAQIGFLYERGLGVKAKPEKAVELYQQAVNAGNKYAKTRLGQLYVQGHIVEQNYDKALQLFEDAAKDGNGKGNAWLGYMYEQGFAVDRNFNKAIQCYQIGADKGNAWAMARLGNMYLHGKGVGQDTALAYSLILSGAERGNSFAIGKLGHMYEKGFVVDIDRDKAFELYQESARLGSGFGLYKLGHAYHHAVGTKKNKHQAIKWYKKAAAKGNRKARKELDMLE